MAAIQKLWNMASYININRRKVVGVQYTRSEIARTDLTPTKNPWKFTITVPGQRWSDMRSTLEELDSMDRYQPETIVIGNSPNTSWLYRYSGGNGSGIAPTTWVVQSFVGNQLTVTNITGLVAGQNVVVAGDMVQISGAPYPFTITTTVPYVGGNTYVLTTHRPNIITNPVAGAALNVGGNCEIAVFMPQLPAYNLVPGGFYRTGNAATDIVNSGIVQFDDNIVLMEYLYGS